MAKRGQVKADEGGEPDANAMQHGTPPQFDGAEPEKTDSATPQGQAPDHPVSTDVAGTYNPSTHIVVDRKKFNRMITTLVLNKGLHLYTGNGLTTQLGEMFGMDKNEPGFYEKARKLMHDIMVEHQKG